MGEQMQPEEIRSAIEHMSASGKLSKELERLFISVHTHLGRIAELKAELKHQVRINTMFAKKHTILVDGLQDTPIYSKGRSRFVLVSELERRIGFALLGKESGDE